MYRRLLASENHSLIIICYPASLWAKPYPYLFRHSDVISHGSIFRCVLIVRFSERDEALGDDVASIKANCKSIRMVNGWWLMSYSTRTNL